MARATMLALLMVPALCSAIARAAVVEHTFTVGGMKISQLCKESVIYTANQQMPGPTIEVNEGDTVVVHVVNDSPYPLSLHWHGIFQLRNGWADGANMITQCPIQPSGRFTYQFNVTGQEGTLWWHAHSSLLRATIYGALIIKPRNGYPFPAPDAEIPILLGEWWHKNVDDVEKDAYLTGLGPELSDALTINGLPGDHNTCNHGAGGTYQVEVEYGKTYLLRIINAAVNVELFFKVAGHTFTVVAADAGYTEPYATDVIVVAPGQTVDALMAATAAPGRRYYMAAHVLETKTVALPFLNFTATAVVKYAGAPDAGPAAMPALPAHTDVAAAGRFYWSLRGLARPGVARAVPRAVDHSLAIGFGLDQAPCEPDQTKCKGFAVVADMNRHSFQFPKSVSLLEALFRGVPGVYAEDFPGSPPPMPMPAKTTSVWKVNYNDVVEVVLQSQGYSSVLGTENHPIHLHGFDFFVLAQGLGRFDPSMKSKYNLVNPQVRNTIAVPANGWAVIRFTANNPGMWFMHCHLDAHLPLGLAMVFEVLNGPAPNLLPPPPADYPKCY